MTERIVQIQKTAYFLARRHRQGFVQFILWGRRGGSAEQPVQRFPRSANHAGRDYRGHPGRVVLEFVESLHQRGG